jgi:hypothetical protein
MTFMDKLLNFVTFGGMDRSRSDDIVQAADRHGHDVRTVLDAVRETTQNELVELGKLRSGIYTGTMTDFVNLHEKIHRVELSPLKERRHHIGDKQVAITIHEIKQTSSSLKELALGGGAGALGGAVVAGGAWGLAGLVGTASTGTAIGTLSGVAASNATLAWLGGGTLAAGGTGVAGGMVVLCGVALAPLAVVGMWLGQSNGERHVNEALAYSEQVDVLIERTKTVVEQLHQIRRGAHLLHVTTAVMEQVLIVQMSHMRTVIDQLETRSFFAKKIVAPLKRMFGLSELSKLQVGVARDAFNSAALLRQLLDMPLMNEDGALMEGAMETLDAQRQQVVSLVPSLPQDQATLIHESGVLASDMPDVDEGDEYESVKVRKSTVVKVAAKRIVPAADEISDLDESKGVTARKSEVHKV